MTPAPSFKRGRVVLRAHPGHTPRMLLEVCRWDVRHALAAARVAGASDTYLSSLIRQAADTTPVISRRARCVGCRRLISLLTPEITHRWTPPSKTVCGGCAGSGGRALFSTT